MDCSLEGLQKIIYILEGACLFCKGCGGEDDVGLLGEFVGEGVDEDDELFSECFGEVFGYPGAWIITRYENHVCLFDLFEEIFVFEGFILFLRILFH